MSGSTKPVAALTDLELVREALAPDYDVLGELGRGGMAVVYEARERMLDRPVALKVLPFSLAHDPDLVERFEREARTAAQLEHPNIIPIYRVGRAGRVIFFAMKMLRGLSLSDRLLAEGPLGAPATRRVLAETAAALGYAHNRGVVHRDIKPDNILFDHDGRCVVTDFGIARSAAESTLTAAGMSMGTPRYMSPEQARAQAVDGRSDLYSLGVVGYECLTGRRPFDGDDMMAILLAHVSQPVPEPTGLGPAERALFSVVRRMLAKAPGERFQSAEALVGALDAPSPADATRPAVPSSSRYAKADSGPASAAALDRALEAGVDMLRQQRPKLEAGLAAGREAVARNAPAVRESAGRAGARLGDAVRRMSDRASHVAEAVLGRARANPVRFCAAIAAGLTLLVGVPTAAHYAMRHRSACPAPGDPPSFELLLEQGSPVRAGSELDLYYDVCGLAPGTGYTARVTVAYQQSGLRRLLDGGVGPITQTYEETAAGPAIRWHRSVELDGMPAGGYAATVTVIDDTGRRRTKTTTFRATD